MAGAARASVREFTRRRVAAVRRSAGSGARSAVAHRAEIALALAALTGWASLTFGIRAVCPLSLARAVWPISTGLLLLSCCGWRYLAQLAAAGLYVTTRKSAGA